MIGSLRRVALREVWPHEAQDFTPWLAENIDVLNNAIDLSLSIIEREQAAGDFIVDLVAEDESGNPVIIENQLERSNHDHLGKQLSLGGYRDGEKWSEIQDTMIDAMIQLEAAFRPHIDRLPT